MNYLAQIGLAALVTGAAASTLSAGTITANVSDAQVKTDGSINSGQLTNWSIRVGEQNAPSAGCMVMAFQLPTLQPGEQFATATFTDQLASFSGTPTFNVDFYGLSRAPAVDPTVLSADFYAGNSDASATRIQDNILTPSSPTRSSKPWPYASFTTSDSGNAALAAYLNAMYANGANAGKYVFLRLSPDLASMPTGNNAYNITSANAGNDFEHPTITYTVAVAAIPEPATITALASAGIALLVRPKGR